MPSKLSLVKELENSGLMLFRSLVGRTRRPVQMNPDARHFAFTAGHVVTLLRIASHLSFTLSPTTTST